jgi:hypothetical protein
MVEDPDWPCSRNWIEGAEAEARAVHCRANWSPAKNALSQGRIATPAAAPDQARAARVQRLGGVNPAIVRWTREIHPEAPRLLTVGRHRQTAKRPIGVLEWAKQEAAAGSAT